MTASHISTGKLGEEIATLYLEKKGYKLIQRNFRCKSGEIDIIATKPSKVLSFVEVKCRIGKKHGMPYESITYGKQKRLVSAIRFYILQNLINDCKLNIEVVSIILNPDKSISEIKHFDDLGTDLQETI